MPFGCAGAVLANCSSSAETPATVGAAKLVPLLLAKPFGDVGMLMLVPGATMSGLLRKSSVRPSELKFATCTVGTPPTAATWPVAPTAMQLKQSAGMVIVLLPITAPPPAPSLPADLVQMMFFLLA